MSVEWYAIVVLFAGLALWLNGSVLTGIILTLFFTLFGGGAAFLVGSSSITPVSFFLVFLLALTLLSMFRRSDHVNIGLSTNVYLAFFCVYAAVTAVLLPKIFAKTMAVPPMTSVKAGALVTMPLVYSKENLIAGIYLISTLVVAVCAGAATADPRSRRTVVTWACIIAWIHIGFGVVGAVLASHGGAAIIAFFRNAKYAELTQDTFGLLRIDGIFPEPSSYGAYAFAWFVFTGELWMRQVRPWRTGVTAAALLAIIIACTSSSTYFGVAVYAVILLLRWLFLPGSQRADKFIVFGISVLSVIVIVLGLVAFLPSVADLATRVLASITVNKLHSTSGVGRLFWMKAGLHAFIKSYGLGVGAGSFRCSSLLLAILGSTGVVGAVAFAGHILKIIRPLKSSTYQLSGVSDPIAVSAAWAACAGLLPDLVSGPSPDPGVLFAVLGGLALGWRYQDARAGAPAAVQVRTGRRELGVAGAVVG